MARLFLALWPDDEIRDKLYEVAKQFKDKDLTLVKKSNLHLTLEFLGEVSEQDQKELINRIDELQHDAFAIELTRTGWWKKPKILWIGTIQIPKELLTLVKSIRKCVKQQGLKVDNREYKPHVTIARKAKQIELPKQTFHINWRVNNFVLVLSSSTDNGVEYRVIKNWNLQS